MPSVAGRAVRKAAPLKAAPRVGVLALQGDVAMHERALAGCGITSVRVTLPEHLKSLDALILPGGESTTMLRLLDSTGLRAPLEAFVRKRPVLGTCAGLILLAKGADRLPRPTLGVLDIDATRNAYGRQVHSFTGSVELEATSEAIEGVFIRAPRITRIGRGVQVIATHEGEAVGVRQGRAVAIAFHPELTADHRLHAWFLDEVAGLAGVAGAR